ncbi:penicillin-binding protein 1A [Catenovulum adriaticum]|uniref:Penicillin-binding protein 1A n=1 Tax=Catenovulum adriaticum TaxID=2984846 RepID=A0ABY7AL51_9ALTE|nr:PBP1A family penicillin-binding protein [Catenovulum sp. TS8]WAJ70258.1 PBP1A family penicillin-binding protein [Catenovulum sp. TS8]
MLFVKKTLKYLLYFTILSSIAGCLTIYATYLYFEDELPSVQSLKDVEFQTPMQVYSAEGLLISQFGEKRRIPMRYEDIPPKLIDTLLATEDNRFFSHNGVDFIGIVRAAITVLTSGTKKQGASTITMQVARGFFLNRDKTYIRKIKEIFIALKMEQELTKEEILTLYINKVELGYRAFGFGAAAKVYYGKNIDELNIAQLSMLTGLLKAPTAYNPLRNPERALFRRNTVLWRLKDANYINEKEYQDAISLPLTAQYHGAEIALDSPYIAEMVRQEMVEKYGEETAYTQGYQVFTTVSSKTQTAAMDALRQNLHNYDERHGYRGPQKALWIDGEESKPSDETLIQQLENEPDFGWLENVVVVNTDTEKNQFSFLRKNGTYDVVNWSGMSWARPYIDDDSQGEEPKSVTDIVKKGDLVSVRKVDDTWQLSQYPDASAALVALDPNNGALKALVGGYDFRQSEFNRVTQAKRQVGSNIKPFIYSAAIAHGFTLASIINDAPINQWDRRQGTVWRPQNSPAVYDGPIRMRKALAKSKNVVSVRLLRAVGLDDLIDHMSKFGFDRNDLPRNESLALGSASFTPLELVSAYSAFANGGFIVEPYLIERIEDMQGNVLFEANPKLACDPCQAEKTEVDSSFSTNPDMTEKTVEPAPRAISAQNSFLIADAMTSTIWGGGNWNRGTGWNGTGWRARVLKRKDIGGKTGTTNEAKDTWFSGYAPDLVVTSWVGFDDHRRALGATSYNNNLGKEQVYGKEFGAQTALPAWVDFLKVALENKPKQSTTLPEDITTVRIDRETGKLTNKTDYSSIFEYFISGTEPTQYIDDSPRIEMLNANQAGEVMDAELNQIF